MSNFRLQTTTSSSSDRSDLPQGTDAEVVQAFVGEVTEFSEHFRKRYRSEPLAHELQMVRAYLLWKARGSPAG